jgi:hypothetical protein
MILVILGFFYLIWWVFQYRNNDTVFFIGVVGLAAYLFISMKLMDRYQDDEESNGKD